MTIPEMTQALRFGLRERIDLHRLTNIADMGRDNNPPHIFFKIKIYDINLVLIH